MKLLVVEDGFVTQKRLLQELEKSRGKIEKKRAAGKAGGIANSLKNKESRVADATADAPADAEQEGQQTGTIYSLLSTTEKKPSVSEESAGEDPDAIFREVAAAEARRKSYRFEEGIVRLTDVDFEKWRARYPHINLEARLASMVDWADQLHKEGKNWFRVFPSRLAKLDDEARIKKEEMKVAAEARAKQGARSAPGRPAI
jgi:hypothetical protein